MPPGTRARHRVLSPPGPAPSGLPHRVWYLLPGLLVLSLFAAGGIYLAQTSGPAPPPATGRVTVQPSPFSCNPAAAGGACAGRPFHAAVASIPPSLSPSAAGIKHSRARPSSASGSASPGPVPSSSAPAAGSPGGTAGGPAAQVLALINQARSAAGLSPLTVTAGLNASAARHNATMSGGCGLSHQCPGEPGLGARETAAGVAWTACGENIGEGGRVAGSSAAIARMAVGLTQSMLSEKPPDDGHRRNILSGSFAHIGIAISRDASGTVWLTQDFSN